MTKLFAPGIEYYVRRIKQGEPFSFQRYHDGEWKAIVPGAAPLFFPPQQIVWSIEKECTILRNTVLNCHRHPNYLMSMFTEIVLPAYRCVREWIAANAPWIKWHNDKVFQKAALGGRLFPFVQAIRRQSLPVVIVGPQYLSRMPLNIAHHIVTPGVKTWPKLWYERGEIKKEILALGKPAFISFSAGMAVNVLIHELWPVIGQHSYMIDVGSLWDGLCGRRNRGWHNRLGKRNIWKSLYGK